MSDLTEVIPGILHWRAHHSRIGVEVSSYLLTGSGTAIDPLLPEGEGPGWLGHTVSRVVLTVRHHGRSADAFRVPVFVHETALHEFDGQDLDLRGYSAGEAVAPGVRALAFGRICPDDAVLHVDLGPGVLAFGDGLINYGELGHPPDQYIGENPEAIKADIVDGLFPLLEEDFDAMLFAHGNPIPSGGKALLSEFLAASASPNW